MFVVGKFCPVCHLLIVNPEDHGWTFCVVSTSVVGPPKKPMTSSGPQEFRSATEESGTGTLKTILQSPKI